MASLCRSLSISAALLAIFAVMAACGGSDDDSDDSSEDDDASSSSGSNSNNNNSGGSAKIPAIKDGTFGEGNLHVEVSGDKDFKLDAQGNGIATGGYALLTFGNSESTVILAFQGDSKDEPGGVSVTATQLSTAGEWGRDCTVDVQDTAKEFKGNFTCKEIEGVDSKSFKAHKIRLSGNFSVPR